MTVAPQAEFFAAPSCESIVFPAVTGAARVICIHRNGVRPVTAGISACFHTDSPET